MALASTETNRNNKHFQANAVTPYTLPLCVHWLQCTVRATFELILRIFAHEHKHGIINMIKTVFLIAHS